MLFWHLIVTIFFACRTIAKKDISGYVTRYEKVWFQPTSPLNTVAMEMKDGCEDGDKTTVLQLRVFGQSLEMRLHRAKSIFSPNATVTTYNNGSQEVLLVSDLVGTSVEGTVNEDNASYVFGKLRNGVFDGVIRSKQETFYVERASKLFRQATRDFNAIVYRSQDVEPCPSGLCEYDSDTVSMGPLDPSERRPDQHRSSKDSTQRRRRRPAKVHDKKPRKMLTPSATTTLHVPQDVFYVCSCKVIVDYTFFEIVGNGDREQTINEIEIVMREAQQVFRQVDVDGDRENETLMVIIHEIHLHRSPSEPDYKLNDEAKSAYDFLDSLSVYDLADYCIGFAFTYRPFARNVLGLAYKGDPLPGSNGGACQRPIIEKSRRKHYNCALVSMANSRNELVPLKVGALTVAHEIAHLFGSSHDDDGEGEEALCTPDDHHGGRYIMFSHHSLQGKGPNSVRLSPCSQRSIMAYLAKKGHCLACHGIDCMHRASLNMASADVSACSLITTPSFIVLVFLAVLSYLLGHRCALDTLTSR